MIHCHGWITSLAPLYIKKAYHDEPSFRDTKIVFSASSPEFKNDLGQHFAECIPFKGATKECFSEICADKLGHTELSKIAIKYSDGIILDDQNVSDELVEYAKSLNIPILDYQPEDKYREAYNEFYDTVFDSKGNVSE